MCIKIKCLVCGELMPFTDIRKRVCNKPECQEAKKHWKFKHRNLAAPRDRRKVRHCKICGKAFPKSSRKHKYCDKCNPRKQFKREGTAYMARMKAGGVPRDANGRFAKSTPEQNQPEPVVTA